MTFKNTSGNAERTLVGLNGYQVSVSTTDPQAYNYLVQRWGEPNKFHLIDEDTIDFCVWVFKTSDDKELSQTVDKIYDILY